MPNDLFNSKTIKKFTSNIEISEDQRVAAEKWLNYLKENKLFDETKNYLKFSSLILKEILGYDIEHLRFEEDNIEFSYPDGDKPILGIEAKGTKVQNLFAEQRGYRPGQETPIFQLWNYMGKLQLSYGIATNYRIFILIDYYKGTSKYYCFDFEGIRNDDDKLKEFIGIFSKQRLIDERIVDHLSEASLIEERDFTKEFYKLYHETRLMLIKEFTENDKNLSKDLAIHYAQVILNRLMFIFFAEDTGKLQERLYEDSIIECLKTILLISDNSRLVSEQTNNLFKLLNKGSENPIRIFGFNGGLFEEEIPDAIYFKDLRQKDFFKEIYLNSKISTELTLDDTIGPIFNRYDGNINPIIKNLLILASFDFKTEVTVNILGHIFEQSISDLEELKGLKVTPNTKSVKRKQDGIYYTESYITDYICRNSIIPYLSEIDSKTPEDLIKEYKGNIDVLENKIKNLRILDPACGSGAFLIKSIDILLDILWEIQNFKTSEGEYSSDLTRVSKSKGQSAKNIRFVFAEKKDNGQVILQRWDDEEQAREIIENNIFGVDKNEESVEITKLSLFFKIATKNRKLINLSKNIRRGNSIINDPNIHLNSFNWDNEFDFVLNNGKFDIILGNPPYGATFSQKEIDYFNQNYSEVVSGEIESYILFYYRGLSLLKEGGRLSFITPDSWFTNVNCANYRNWVITNFSIIDIYDWYKPFVDAKDTRCHSIVIQKSFSDTRIRVQQVLPSKPTKICRRFCLDPGLLRRYGKEKWRVYITPEERPFIERMETVSVPLEELYHIKYGMRTGNNSEYISNESGIYRVVEGKNIEPYYVNPKTNYLIKNDGLPQSYFGDERSQPKILIQYVRSNALNVTAKWIEAAYCDNGCIPLNSLNYIYERDNEHSLKYLLALCNSFLLNRYYRLFYTDVNVKKTYLAELPIPDIDLSNQQPFVVRVDTITQNKNEIIKKRDEFLSVIHYKFGVSRLTPKIFHFYNVEFKEFMREIEKQSTKKQPKELLEWIQFFDEYQKAIQVLIEENIRLMDEIDDMVYKLYQIQPEEIGIVKNYCNV